MTDFNNTDSQESTVNREPMQMMLIGSPNAITRTIRTLSNLGFANINEWSPLSPSLLPGKMMSTLTRDVRWQH